VFQELTARNRGVHGRDERAGGYHLAILKSTPPILRFQRAWF
jgi:hypothetical protein